ncbi:hypothetical protein UlMin_044910 [Ulmus minor]
MSTSEPPPELIPLLPSDVARECLARIPLWQHPKLSIVSKSNKSLMKSPLLFSSRTKLNCTEHVLYLTLRSSSNLDSWYILYRKPHLNPNPTGQDFKILTVHIPPISNPSFQSQIILLGTKIYVLGGFFSGFQPSSDVWVLDCRFNTWEQGLSLPMGRFFFIAGAIDGKIHLSDTSCNKAFDPVSGRLEEFLRSEDVQTFKGKRLLLWYVFVAGGRFYGNVDDGEGSITVLYEPTTNAWIGLGKDEDRLHLDFCYHRNFCEIDGVLYYCDSLGKLRGFNVENEVLKDLRGVDEELIFPDGKVANVGGRLVVVWKKEKRGEKEEEGKGKRNGEGEGEENGEEKEKEVDIWYAEIELKNLGDGDLRGKILFSQKILSASSGSKFVHFASVSV